MGICLQLASVTGKGVLNHLVLPEKKREDMQEPRDSCATWFSSDLCGSMNSIAVHNHNCKA